VGVFKLDQGFPIQLDKNSRIINAFIAHKQTWSLTKAELEVKDLIKIVKF
jgi:hypothetical protein